MPNPREGGEKTAFRFSFRSHNTGGLRLGDTERAIVTGVPHPHCVAHAVKMMLGRRSVVLAASHVIALGRLTLPFCLARAESLARARRTLPVET